MSRLIMLNALAVMLLAGLQGCEVEPRESPGAPGEVEQWNEPIDEPSRGPGETSGLESPPPPQSPSDPPEPRRTSADANDRQITEQIRNALAGDDWLSSEARNIDVETRQGVVTMRGSVETIDERDIVLDIAWEVPGVEEVIDELEIREDGPRSMGPDG